MSFVRAVTIWCDYPGCGRGHQTPYGRRTPSTAVQVREDAAKHAWVYVPGFPEAGRVPQDFCPTHAGRANR